jgi:cytochrome bd-type quinol oxidase subunit 1
MAEYEYTYVCCKIRPGQPWVAQNVVPGRHDRLNSTMPTTTTTTIIIIIIIIIIIMHFSTMLI